MSWNSDAMFPFGLQGLGTKPSLVCVVFSPQQKATTQWNLNVCFPHVYTYNLSFHHLIVQIYLVSTYHVIILLFRNIWLLFTNLASYHLNYNISYIYIIMFMLYQFLDSMRFLCFLLNMNQNHPTHSCCTAIKASTIDSHKNESAYLSGF